MDWKIEKLGNNYHVLGYDEDGLVCLDRDVDNFTEACQLVDETRVKIKECTSQQKSKQGR